MTDPVRSENFFPKFKYSSSFECSHEPLRQIPVCLSNRLGVCSLLQSHRKSKGGGRVHFLKTIDRNGMLIFTPG